ncbi:MAG TPA: HNH endonuclease [Allosphingosinicella sp.]|jgi:predicted metal-dependent phosphoesterase TrpH
MRNVNRFTKPIIATLAKRAANRCSNPDCGALTSGPARKRTASVNVGEGAHIFGAHESSARYDAAMEPAERASIENAIWLCGNYHKLIDDDPARYPAGLLFEWQREHERQIMEQVGKAGAELRRRYEERQLEELGKLSYLS